MIELVLGWLAWCFVIIIVMLALDE